MLKKKKKILCNIGVSCGFLDVCHHLYNPLVLSWSKERKRPSQRKWKTTKHKKDLQIKINNKVLGILHVLSFEKEQHFPFPQVTKLFAWNERRSPIWVVISLPYTLVSKGEWEYKSRKKLSPNCLRFFI